jgi:hypothetical protein
MAIMLGTEFMGGKIKDRIKARKENKAAGKSRDPGLAERALTKKFGDKFKNATPAQKKQLIVMFFSPIPPITKRLLMLRVLAKGAISKDKIKKGAKVALRFATGGASILAEKIAQRAKAKKEAAAQQAAIEEQAEPEEVVEDAMEKAPSNRINAAAQAQARAKAARGRRGGRAVNSGATGGGGSIQESDMDDGEDQSESGNDIGVMDNRQIISKDKLKGTSQSFDMKKYALPLLGAGVALYFMTKKKGR